MESTQETDLVKTEPSEDAPCTDTMVVSTNMDTSSHIKTEGEVQPCAGIAEDIPDTFIKDEIDATSATKNSKTGKGKRERGNPRTKPYSKYLKKREQCRKNFKNVTGVHLMEQFSPAQTNVLLEKGWSPIYHQSRVMRLKGKLDNVRFWVSPTGEKHHLKSKIRELAGLEEEIKPKPPPIDPRNILDGQAKRVRKPVRSYDPAEYQKSSVSQQLQEPIKKEIPSISEANVVVYDELEEDWSSESDSGDEDEIEHTTRVRRDENVKEEVQLKDNAEINCPGIYQSEYIDNFSVQRPKYIIRDKKIRLNSTVKSLASLPASLMISATKNNSLGIFAANEIPQFTQFGPLQGVPIKEDDVDKNTDIAHIWILPYEDLNDRTFLDTRDETTSNWCRYLRPFKRDYNLLAFVREDGIYFVTMKTIREGEELCFRNHSMFLLYRSLYSNWHPPKKHCQACGIKFHLKADYCKHLIIFHPKGKLGRVKIRCSMCNVFLYSEQSAREHFKKEHNGMVGFGCKVCGKQLASHISMIRHLAESHGQNEDGSKAVKIERTCQMCNQKYTRSQCSCTREYVACSLCEKKIRGKQALKRHMRTHSSDTLGVSCEKCGKRFRDTSNLRVHLLTHSKVKPFQCSEKDCPAGYTTKQCLQIHYRRIHGYNDDNMPDIKRVVPFTDKDYSEMDQTASETDSCAGPVHSNANVAHASSQKTQMLPMDTQQIFNQNVGPYVENYSMGYSSSAALSNNMMFGQY